MRYFKYASPILQREMIFKLDNGHLYKYDWTYEQRVLIPSGEYKFKRSWVSINDTGLAKDVLRYGIEIDEKDVFLEML